MGEKVTDQYRQPGRRSPVAVVVGFFGELMVTLGVIALLFVVWELWWTNIDSAVEQNQAISGLAKQLDVDILEDQNKDFGPVPVTDTNDSGTFGILYFPTWGSEGRFHPVSEGVGPEIIDHLGIGHYPNTEDPGELGNFAVAAHRQTHGQVFWEMDELGSGDKVYLQTEEGYYTYAWYKTEIIEPSESDVLLPVPWHPEQKPSESILTMTTCHPLYTTRQRMVAHSRLVDWQPLSAGPPKEIQVLVTKAIG